MAEEKKLSAKVEKIGKEIEGLTAVELSELAKYLEEKFGITSMPMAMPTTAPQSPTVTSSSTPTEEKSTFTVILKEVGANKLAVIKAVREILPNLGLLDAKKLVESVPKEILKDVKKEAAEEAKKKIETAGGKVELK